MASIGKLPSLIFGQNPHQLNLNPLGEFR